MIKRFFKGFTLAEVLIVVGIIGMIAEMTIPTLMSNVQEKQTAVALKKAFSNLSNVYNLATQENGTPDTWNVTADGAGADTVIKMFAPYLKITKNCGTGGNCFSGENYYHLNGNSRGDINSDASISKAQLSDGSLLGYAVLSNTCVENWGSSKELQNICGYFYIDTNGFKKPNIVGKDFFLIYMTKYGLVPTGSPSETTGYTFTTDCLGKHAGWGCSAWVIYNENLDYLKCNTLDWNSKTKCG